MTTKRRKKTPIDIILSRAQNLQTSCFGTPIGVTIEASKGTYDAKVLSVTIYSPLGEDKLYVISSSMTKEEITQIWGSIKDEADKLLDELVGHRITKRGNLKQVTPLAPKKGRKSLSWNCLFSSVCIKFIININLIL